MKLSLPLNSPMTKPAFTFGVATAAFQIEGAGASRLPCIWDTFCATPGKIKDHSDGQSACQHVALWRQDVELIESLGVDAYRFSISWPRVIKQDGTINESGVNFYIQLLDALNQKNIKPFVTLYHWDLPQHLQDKGGWLNRETAYHFADYADRISRAFGDRVYSYATLNEPFCSAYLGYETGIHAPGISGKEFGKKAAHHLLLAHGLAMAALQKNSPHSKNGIVLNFTPCYPMSNRAPDIAAAKLADEHFNQWYARPILDAQYPSIIEQLPQAELPDIVAGDLEIIAHPIDFLGINYYTRTVYRANIDNGFEEVPQLIAPRTDMGWEIYPQALTEFLLALDKHYHLPEIYITENGAAMKDEVVDGKVNDLDRIAYLQEHLTAVNNAIAQGLNIKGYFAWSLMDNFEWAEGYEKRFGIVYVDFKTQQRLIKASGYAYRDFISGRKD